VSSEVTGGSPRRAGGAAVPAGGGVVLGGCPAEGSGYRTGPVPSALPGEWPVAGPAVPFAGRDGPLGGATARMPIERLTVPDDPLARYPAAGPAAAGRASGGRAAEGPPSGPAAWLGPVGRLGPAPWLGPVGPDTPVGPVGRLGPFGREVGARPGAPGGSRRGADGWVRWRTPVGPPAASPAEPAAASPAEREPEPAASPAEPKPAANPAEPASPAEGKACLKTVEDVRWTMTREERAKTARRDKPIVSSPTGLF